MYARENNRVGRERSGGNGGAFALVALLVVVVGLPVATPSAGAADLDVTAAGAPVENRYRCTLIDAPFTVVDTTIASRGDAPATARFGETIAVTGITIVVGADLTGVPGPGSPASTVTNIWPSVNAAGALSFSVSVGPLPDTVVAPGGGFTSGPVHGIATMGPWGEGTDFRLDGVSFTITSSTAGGTVLNRWNCLRLQGVVPFAATVRVDPVRDSLVVAEADLLARVPSLQPGPAALAGSAATLLGDGPTGARTALDFGDHRETARRIFLAQLLVHLAIGQGATSLTGDEVVLASANLALGGDAVLLAQLRSGCPNVNPQCPSLITLLGTYVVQLEAGRAARDRGELLVAGWTGAAVVDRAAAIGPPF